MTVLIILGVVVLLAALGGGGCVFSKKFRYCVNAVLTAFVLDTSFICTMGNQRLVPLRIRTSLILSQRKPL